uniref:Uncharacterized protein n=1 Tax=Cannabis sativa TaxID=3483 RepID=A0A803PB84_CANSA
MELGTCGTGYPSLFKVLLEILHSSRSGSILLHSTSVYHLLTRWLYPSVPFTSRVVDEEASLLASHKSIDALTVKDLIRDLLHGNPTKLKETIAVIIVEEALKAVKAYKRATTYTPNGLVEKIFTTISQRSDEVRDLPKGVCCKRKALQSSDPRAKKQSLLAKGQSTVHKVPASTVVSYPLTTSSAVDSSSLGREIETSLASVLL